MAHVLRVLEHSLLKVGTRQGSGENAAEFKPAHWQQLLRFHDTAAGGRYYDIRHRAVRFKHYVGVLQVGDLTIEVLPKADAVPGAEADGNEDFDRWRRLLLRLLAEAGLLPVDAFGTAHLRERPHSLLDLYLDLFMTEVETLLRRGLVRRYRQHEGQVKALKGSLLFGPHLARNVVHQERFYTRHQTYDPDHLPHRLLRQALALLPALTHEAGLRGRAARALLAWPEVAAVGGVSAATFAGLRLGRKLAAYRPALGMARLLLLRLSPDLSAGPNDLIALFFNMNHIWETYLLRTLQRLAPAGWEVEKPGKVVFWEAADGRTQSRMQPDILLRHPAHGTLVLDAKWKRPQGPPAEADLRQLFAYAQHFGAKQARLLYPQTGGDASAEGQFLPKLFDPTTEQLETIRCGVSYIGIGGAAGADDTDEATGRLRCSIGDELPGWLAGA